MPTYFKQELMQAQLIGVDAYIQQCLKNKVDLNERDDNGFSRLHYAVYSGQVELVAAMVENGADINIQSKDPQSFGVKEGFTPLQIALAPQIMDKTSDPRNDCTYALPDMVNLLIGSHAKTDTTHTMSPLRIAIITGQYEHACSLIKAGANVHEVDWVNDGLLHIASIPSSGYPYYNETAYRECFSLLVESGVDVTQKGWWGLSPIELLCLGINLGFSSYCFDKNNGQEVSIFDQLLLKLPHSQLNDKIDNPNYHEGGTLLHCAIENDNLFAIRALLFHGIDSTIVDSSGRTAKEYALEKGCEHIYAYLDQMDKLNIDLKNATNELQFQTIYDQYLKKLNDIVVEYQHFHENDSFDNRDNHFIFGEDPENINLKDSLEGTYPVKVYTEFGHIDEVEAYLKAGFNLNQGNWHTDNLTPVENAIKFQQPTIAKLFLEYGFPMEITHDDNELKSNSILIQAIETLKDDAPKADLISYMIENKANVNVVDQFGMTPLLTACFKNDINTVKQLIAHPEIDVHYQEQTTKMSALDVAHGHHFVEIEKILTAYDDNGLQQDLHPIYLADVIDIDKSAISNDIINNSMTTTSTCKCVCSPAQNNVMNLHTVELTMHVAESVL